MALEDVAPGQASDGFGLVVFVPETPGIADVDAPSVSEIAGGIPLTYSLVPDGFRHETTENVIQSGRYTLKQILELPGTVVDTLEVQYVYTGTSADIARTTLAEGTRGFIVHRLGVANEVPFENGQIVDVIPVQAGIQRKVAPTANTELQRVQKLHVVGALGRDAVVGGDES